MAIHSDNPEVIATALAIINEEVARIEREQAQGKMTLRQEHDRRFLARYGRKGASRERMLRGRR